MDHPTHQALPTETNLGDDQMKCENFVFCERSKIVIFRFNVDVFS